MKHAPRGPVKARSDGADLIHHPDHTHHVGPKGGHATRCTAKAKHSQRQCCNPAIQGATVCRMHGGSAPQVRAKAEFRVMEAYRALQPKAVGVLGTLLEREEYPTVQIAAVREVMDRTEGKPAESVAITGAEGGPIEFLIRKPWADAPTD